MILSKVLRVYRSLPGGRIGEGYQRVQKGQKKRKPYTVAFLAECDPWQDALHLEVFPGRPVPGFYSYASPHHTGRAGGVYVRPRNEPFPVPSLT